MNSYKKMLLTNILVTALFLSISIVHGVDDSNSHRAEVLEVSVPEYVPSGELFEFEAVVSYTIPNTTDIQYGIVDYSTGEILDLSTDTLEEDEKTIHVIHMRAPEEEGTYVWTFEVVFFINGLVHMTPEVGAMDVTFNVGEPEPDDPDTQPEPGTTISEPISSDTNQTENGGTDANPDEDDSGNQGGWGIPGFPYGSILLGLSALWVLLSSRREPTLL